MEKQKTVKSNKKEKVSNDLTRGTKKLIMSAIERTGDLNRAKLCEAISDELCDKFQGDSLEYQLKRMKLETTKDINNAIDTYMFRHIKINSNKVKNSNKNNESEK